MNRPARSTASWLHRITDWLTLPSREGGRDVRRRRGAARPPSLERLEDRCLLSTLQAITLSANNPPPSDSAAGASDSPSVSANGQYVAFESKASNLVVGQTGAPDVENVYLRNTLTNTTVLVSHPSNSTTAAPLSGFPSYTPIISQDGRFILYGSEAPEFAPGSPLTPFDGVVVLYNVQTGQNTLLSHSSGSPTAPAAGISDPEAVSANGRYVLFTNQVTASSPTELFVYDTTLGTTQLVNHAVGQNTVPDNGGANTGFIGQDGKVVYAKVGTASVANNGMVVYVDSSPVANLVGGGGGTESDVYLYNSATQVNQLVSFDPSFPNKLEGGGGVTFGAVISADGSTVAYVSDDDLVSGMTSSLIDNVFSYNVSTATNTLVSGAGGAKTTGGDHNSGAAGLSLVVSSDGQFIAFTSAADNLIPGQNGAAGNVFLYHNAPTPSLVLLSGVNGSPTMGAGGVPDLTPSGIPTGPQTPTGPTDPITNAEVFGGPQVLSMSDDGSLIAYVSAAGNIVSGQTGTAGADNVFLYSNAHNTLVTGVNGSTTTTAALESSFPVLSGNGNLLAFHSMATNLNAKNDLNGVADVFTYTPGSAGVALVTGAAFHPTTPGDSFSTSVSADGTYTVFTSNATNLLTNQVTVNSQQNVFLYINQPGQPAQIQLVNHAPGTTNTTGDGGVHPLFFPEANNDFRPPVYVQPVISADGSIIAFTSFDDNLVVNEAKSPLARDQVADEFIYLYQVSNGQITLVPTVHVGTSYFDSFQPVISADGNYVAFVFGKAGGDGVGVALYSRLTGVTTIIASYADRGGFVARNPAISDDGRYVVFQSGPSGSDVSLFDRISGTTTPVSSGASGAVISHDGKHIAFVSAATNLVSGQTGPPGLTNVFLYQNDGSGAISLVSHVNGSPTLTGDGNSDNPAIDLDGSYVAFRSDADNLVAGQSSQTGNIFEFNTLTSTQTLVSHQAGAAAAAGGSFEPVIDDNGLLVSYVSAAGNLVPNQAATGGFTNVFLWSRQTGASILVSGVNGSATVGGNANSDSPLLTRHSFPGFTSTASNLVTSSGLASQSVAYINRLVSLILSPSTLADGSPAGTAVGTLTIVSQLIGSFLPPTLSLTAGEPNFGLTDDQTTLFTKFRASFTGENSYIVSVQINVGFGDQIGVLTVAVAPPEQRQVGVPLAPTFVLNADGSLTEQTPDPSGGQLLSGPGTIRDISSVASKDGNVVFAITTSGNDLWEHTPSGWFPLSSGSFEQISAATNAAGQAVVFGILSNNSLWEQDPSRGVGPDVGWLEASSGAFSAVIAVGTSAGAVAYGIIGPADPGNAGTLWRYNAAANTWAEQSTGDFGQISVGLNTKGQTIVFAVLSNGQLWEQDPANGTGVDVGWTRVGTGTALIVSASGTPGAAVFIDSAQHLELFRPGVGLSLLSGGAFAEVSASPTAVKDDLFATLIDGSLWEYADDLPGDHWRNLLTGGVIFTSAP